MVRLFTDGPATRSEGKAKPNFCCALLSSASVYPSAHLPDVIALHPCRFHANLPSLDLTNVAFLRMYTAWFWMRPARCSGSGSFLPSPAASHHDSQAATHSSASVCRQIDAAARSAHHRVRSPLSIRVIRRAILARAPCRGLFSEDPSSGADRTAQ